MTIHEHLLSVGEGKWKACQDARDWAAQYQTAQEVWDNCPQVTWLFWWSARMGQHRAVANAAKEIAQSVAHLHNWWSSKAAAYAAAAADADADADADAADAADAAYAAYAAYAAARQRQKELNMQIAHKHLVCPWHETD
jgi:hypothetical protein